MKRTFRRVFLAALAALPLACATELPMPNDAMVTTVGQNWPGTRLSDLVAGRRSYADHCAACHILKSPSQYAQAEWPVILRRMKVRANIDDATADSILRYLTAVSPSVPPANRPGE